MALPTYTTPGQRLGYYTYLTYCGMVFFFLIAPIFVKLVHSFSLKYTVCSIISILSGNNANL